MSDQSAHHSDRDTRRAFIQKTASTAAIAFAGAKILPGTFAAQDSSKRVVILPDTTDEILALKPVRWAIGELRDALVAKHCAVEIGSELEPRPPVTERIFVARSSSASARAILDAAGITPSTAPESFALMRGPLKNQPVLLACGADVRGIVYAVLELADRVTHAADPIVILRSTERLIEKPTNSVRSITRVFLGGIQDKPWFYDRSFWERYLSMLVTQRFNRFSLAFGMAYDAPVAVGDSYFHFAYPFLLAVPGYQVVARGLPNEERDRNLAMLRWISDEAAGRGLHFQLGLWNQGYEFKDSPQVDHLITGLTASNHAEYCRDALQALLAACPAISGITFRCHSESGVADGGYHFWPMLFEGVVRSGRKVEIDLHSKGIEHKLLDLALRTGLPVNVSPKYSGEHMGLPYHPTAIQERERFKSVAGRPSTLEEQRSFTRYGYADYLREDRRYSVFFRVWPATQRLLLWGDPVTAAGYGRLAGIGGSRGLELYEPLSLKGRRGAVSDGGRETYADPALRPPGGDWEKYLYTYRVWGRLLYNPDADPNSWGRYLRTEFGAAAGDCESALANASRILPLITTAHMPSPSVGAYWPEIHTNIPIVTKRFAGVHGLDPGLFSSLDEFADEWVQGRRSGKYSPIDVAQWLERLADGADVHLSKARGLVANAGSPAFRRLAVDTRVQSGTGRYLAQKLRAGFGFALYERQKDPAVLKLAITHYRLARDAWAQIVAVTRGVYKDDLVFDIKARPYLRGNWADRLPAIDEDLQAMEKILAGQPPSSSGKVTAGRPNAVALFTAALMTAAKPGSPPRYDHRPPISFRAGTPVTIEMTMPAGESLASARLHYSRVNLSEETRVADFTVAGNRYRQTIPSEYTNSPYPLLYYFELHDRQGGAWLGPGLAADLSNQPYYIVRQMQA